MKNYLRLFLIISTFSFSFSVSADTQKGIILRGFVAEKVSVNAVMQNGKPKLHVVTNSLQQKIVPKLNFSVEKNSYVVAVVQP